MTKTILFMLFVISGAQNLTQSYRPPEYYLFLKFYQGMRREAQTQVTSDPRIPARFVKGSPTKGPVSWTHCSHSRT